MGIYDNEREQLQSQVDKLEVLVGQLRLDCEIAEELSLELREERDEANAEVGAMQVCFDMRDTDKADLKEENAMLAEENKNMANHMLANDYSSDEVDNICKGFDDWMDEDVDPNEPTPSQMNEELRSGGW